MTTPELRTPQQQPEVEHGDRCERFCIIGAGPSGLGAARALKQAGIPFDVIERQHDVGGIWNGDSGRTPMYESAHFISSKTQSAFSNFPMPESYPDYPGWRQILHYLRSFAVEHDLRRHIELGIEVERATPSDAGWDVRLSSGETRRYRGLIIAAGHQWMPRTPGYRGTFDGEAYHSFHYRSANQLREKRVLIVGGGNSGCDIACDAAANARQAWISLRRGYYFLPKHIFGKPTDLFFRSGPELPTWLAQPLLTVLLRVFVGDLSRLGLQRPDHKVLESHPIVNSQLLHYLAHGDITAKPDVAELQGKRVRFVDGSEVEVDVIIWAIGYQLAFPFLDDGIISATSPMADLASGVLHRRHSNLYVLGLFETDGGAYPVISRQAELVARAIRAREANGVGARKLESLIRQSPNLSGGVRYLRSPRHAISVQYEAYMHHLDRVIASLPPVSAVRPMASAIPRA
ncbi:MAG TPA: NAD(P)-binding domain-containing protein [Gemmatimonadaceae bacterium]|nr:NAD(P)-binding domain-containing protein [Gemmatimonadaceae bacterium]